MSQIKEANAIRLVEGFGIENLSFDQIQVPEPQANGIEIAIRAVSLNYREILVTYGRYGTINQLPLVLGPMRLAKLSAWVQR